jgi:hypothetical protein
VESRRVKTLGEGVRTSRLSEPRARAAKADSPLANLTKPKPCPQRGTKEFTTYELYIGMLRDDHSKPAQFASLSATSEGDPYLGLARGLVHDHGGLLDVAELIEGGGQRLIRGAPADATHKELAVHL